MSPLLASWLRRLVLVVQLVVALLPLQASGVLHVVADVATTVLGEQVHQGDPLCSYEARGERCPPDCPHCHGSPSLPVLPVAWPAFEPPRVRTLAMVRHTYDATAPPHPLLSGLERPPRHDRLV